LAQTTAAINACDVVVKLDNDGNPQTLVDISGSSNQVTMNLTNALGVLHMFGSRWPIRLECKSDAEITLRAVYSEVDAEAVRQLLRWYFTDRGHKTLTVDVPDGSAGGDKYTFEVFLASLSIPLDGADANPVLVEAVMQPTGEFTLTAIAS